MLYRQGPNLILCGAISGVEQGLLGLALDPDFDNNGYVYLHATVPDHGSGADHAEVIRMTDVANVGTNALVIVDDIPMANHNGGDLAGKVLRYTSDGLVPADNPFAGDPEWARGLRNTFAMTLHPVTGDLFGGDSGTLANDRVNYLEAGKNFSWGLATGQSVASSELGLNVLTWEDAITPTALMFHSGVGQAEFENNLFYASYSAETIGRLVLSGDDFTDFVSDFEFISFNSDGDNNRPMHIIETTDGGLYIATLSAIYHVYPTVQQ